MLTARLENMDGRKDVHRGHVLAATIRAVLVEITYPGLSWKRKEKKKDKKVMH